MKNRPNRSLLYKDNVTEITDNRQYRQITEALDGLRNGDFSVRLPDSFGNLSRAFNELAAFHETFAMEFNRIADSIGVDGLLSERIAMKSANGSWKEILQSNNLLIDNLTQPLYEIDRVISAVAEGELTEKVGADCKGELLSLKKTVNTMVDRLNTCAREVTRVAHEIGSEGQLGGQVEVKGLAGSWKGLTDNVNLMANNLTTQVRNFADVASAVAHGDLSKQVTVKATGEIQELKNTINQMVDQMYSFGLEVTRVTREVGIDSKLGGQAKVEGAVGIWKDLTYNVNIMAKNVTNQVRNIAEITGTLSASAKSLMDVSHQMTADAEETSTQAANVNEAASEVSGKIHSVATATDELNSCIKEIAGNANKAAEVATQAVQMADETNVTVTNLGESSSEIGNIVKVINSIAQQTNLLALNANIEAARAGEAGKGFTVVANEVKELAKKTSAATTDIGAKIEAIQNETRGAVDAISNIRTIINNIFDMQNTIASAVEQQSTTTNEIVRTIDQTAKGASDIAKNITVVSQAAESTTSGAANSRESADELSGLAADLQKLIGHFTY